MRILTAAIFVLLSGAAASAQVAPTGTWRTEGSISFTYFYGGSASDGTSLYMMGGWSLSSSIRKYDPASDAWTVLADMPYFQRGNAGAYCDGAIYSFGMDLNGIGAVMKYDISSNSWVAPEVNTGHGPSLGAAVIGSKIYLTGGYFSGSTDVCSEFDTATGQVRSRARMPVALSYHASAAVGGKVYVFGGLGPLSGVHEYDPATDLWTSRGTIRRAGAEVPLLWPRALVLNDRIYLSGGLATGGDVNSATLEFSPHRGIWRNRANTPASRYAHGAAVIGGRGYVFGGRGLGYQTIDEFTPPDLGVAPVAQDLRQTGSTGITPQGGWTNSVMTFGADVTDAEPGQRVRLEVQVKPAADAGWHAAAILDSGFQPQGRIDIEHALPADGAYDWRYRVSDENDLFTPVSDGVPGWIDFDAASPDFNSDQVAPRVPAGQSPEGEVRVPDRHAYPIEFRWTASSDNGPSFGYEIQVSLDDPEFGAPLFTASALVANGVTFQLPVSRYDYTWRVRAVDQSGNASAWSVARSFRVLFEDGINHAEGDATRVCGFSASASGSPIIMLVVVALVAVSRGRRRCPAPGLF